MSKVLHRSLKNTLPTAIGGEGIYLYDSHGKSYLDACGGAAVSCLGHNHREVLETIKYQAEQLSFAHTGFFTNSPMEDLAEHLIDHAPKSTKSVNLSHIYFTSGGSEAIEAALKIARQYWCEEGKETKSYVISRHLSYHGATLGALTFGDCGWRRQPFEPLLSSFHYVTPSFSYRYKQDHETDDEFCDRLINEIEDKILELGPEHVSAFLAETVVGATAGAVVPVKGYFKKLRELCTEYNIFLILDEVMCGMGRTGDLHACNYEGITPDLMAVAKGLSGGYQPLGALYISEDIYRSIQNQSAVLKHGHTFMGHALACATARTVQHIIHRDNLLDQVKELGNYLQQKLDKAFLNHPFIGDIRGRGLFRGIELVEDKETKKPFSPEKTIFKQIKQTCFKNGLMVYPSKGTIDGFTGDHILLAPPYIINKDQIDELVRLLSKSLEEIFGC